jgi:hypothetical protein
MGQNQTTLTVLERLAAMRDRARDIAAKVNQHVTCALNGIPWPHKESDKPNIQLLDARPPDWWEEGTAHDRSCLDDPNSF